MRRLPPFVKCVRLPVGTVLAVCDHVCDRMAPVPSIGLANANVFRAPIGEPFELPMESEPTIKAEYLALCQDCAVAMGDPAQPIAVTALCLNGPESVDALVMDLVDVPTQT